MTLGLAFLFVLLVSGCTDALSDSDPTATSTAETSLLPMTLTTWLLPPGAPAATADPVGVAHLSIAPMSPGENDVTVSLSDLDGNPLPLADHDATLRIDYRRLEPDATVERVTPERAPDAAATWTVDGLPLSEQGWYALELGLRDGGRSVAAATLYILLPDPSVYSSDALELPATDPDAEVLYERALASYGAWETGRWRESLGSGTDVLVVTDYAVVDTAQGETATSSRSRYAGSFRERPDGTEPAPPRRDFARRIVVGDQAWSREDAGPWTRASSPGASGFPERAGIYTGATNILPGGTEAIDGTDTRIVTFYLPRKGGQAEAWFAWWIDPATGNPLRMAMIAEMHFMVWDFHGIDAPLTIAPPSAGEVATPAG